MSSQNKVQQRFNYKSHIFSLLLSGTILSACTNTEIVEPNPNEQTTSTRNGHKTGAVNPDANGRAGEGAVFFNNPRAIGEEPNGNIIVADFSSGHIVRIDRQTGDRQVLSDNNNPDQGPVFSQAAGVAILPDGRIFVSDLVFNNVYEIDTVTGQRTVVSDERNFQIRQPFGITEGIVNGKRMIVVADTGSPEDGGVVGPVLMDPDTGEVIPIPVPSDKYSMPLICPKPFTGVTENSVRFPSRSTKMTPGAPKSVTIYPSSTVWMPCGLSMLKPEPACSP